MEDSLVEQHGSSVGIGSIDESNSALVVHDPGHLVAPPKLALTPASARPPLSSPFDRYRGIDTERQIVYVSPGKLVTQGDSFRSDDLYKEIIQGHAFLPAPAAVVSVEDHQAAQMEADLDAFEETLAAHHQRLEWIYVGAKNAFDRVDETMRHHNHCLNALNAHAQQVETKFNDHTGRLEATEAVQQRVIGASEKLYGDVKVNRENLESIGAHYNKFFTETKATGKETHAAVQSLNSAQADMDARIAHLESAMTRMTDVEQRLQALEEEMPNRASGPDLQVVEEVMTAKLLQLEHTVANAITTAREESDRRVAQVQQGVADITSRILQEKTASSVSEEMLALYVRDQISERLPSALNEPLQATAAEMRAVQQEIATLRAYLQPRPAHPPPAPPAASRPPPAPVSEGWDAVSDLTETGSDSDGTEPAPVRPVRGDDDRHSIPSVDRRLNFPYGGPNTATNPTPAPRSKFPLFEEQRKHMAKTFKQKWNGRVEDWPRWKRSWDLWFRTVSAGCEGESDYELVKLSTFLHLMPDKTREDLQNMLTIEGMTYEAAFNHVNAMNSMSVDVLHRNRLQEMKCPTNFEGIVQFIPEWRRMAEAALLDGWHARLFFLQHNINAGQLKLIVQAEQDRTLRAFAPEDFTPWDEGVHFLADPTSGKNVFSPAGAMEYLRRKYLQTYHSSMVQKIQGHQDGPARTRAVSADAREKWQCSFCGKKGHTIEYCKACKSAGEAHRDRKSDVTKESSEPRGRTSSRDLQKKREDTPKGVPPYWTCWSCGKRGKHKSPDCPDFDSTLPFTPEKYRSKSRTRAASATPAPASQ
jgi:hypothetical protein